MKLAIYPKFLQESLLKLVFFGGKGGVGKSTCASATALKLAQEQPHHHFLLVSTDPAHSLKNILSDLVLPKNLEVRELNAAASLHEFKMRHDALLKEIADRGTFLDKNDIQGLMDAALPGMDELAAYLEIAEWIQQDIYYRIIIDTAPTGHTLRLLEMPDLIHRWLTALDTLLAKHRYMRKRFGGDNRLDHLDHFLLDMNDSLKAMHSLMTDTGRCCFILVMLAETMSVEESIDLVNALNKQRVFMSDLVVNRLFPKNDCPTCLAERSRQMLALKNALKRLPGHLFWTLPLLAAEPSGKLLYSLWSEVRLLEKNEVMPTAYSYKLPLHVENPIQLPASTLRLLIFAGKGGVGKTTLACATALRLHSEYPQLRILLFSTDPAHSLSDCLGINVQRHPTSVPSTTLPSTTLRTGLVKIDAQEINAKADFEKIRRDYRAELEGFLQDALPRLDITFDREVMEHLLDLAPPGLDEIMALTTIMNHLDSDRYDTIIVDAAPSGHLLRLLELPELIRDWLKQFFSLLLKYRQIMRLPHLSERLVQLSRELKNLRILLQNIEQTELYAVTIPTHLAIEKTSEMICALQRLGMTAKALFINQITPVSDCALCQAINARESLQLERTHDIFPNQPQAQIYRQIEPTGLSELKALGSALFL
ncbi:MAG: ArsA family ATPase [Methylobacter sp.]|nr:ArsA family ATPase [Methylobacter sp.]